MKYIEPNIEKIVSGNFLDHSLTSLPGWASFMSLQIENLYVSEIPRHTSIRPVLIYLGEVHDEVLDTNYFSQIINIEALLGE